MNTERLRRLRSLLDGLDEAQTAAFDLDYWSYRGRRDAVGLAALDRWFRRQGLRLALTGGHHDMLPRPAFDGRYNWDAVAAFFGLTLAEADHLFHPEHHLVRQGLPAVLAVIERLTVLLQGQEVAA